MKKFFFSIVLFLAFSPLARGQKIRAEAFAGYGTFSMDGTRQMMRTAIRESDVPLKLVEDFPSFYTYGFSFMHIINEKKKFPAYVGFALSRASTGSRAHYQDYSGSITLDHLAKSTTLSYFLEKELLKVNQFHFAFNGALSLIVTDYRIKSHVLIYTYEEEENLELKSSSLALEPGLTTLYQITPYLYVKGKLSVVLDTGGKLHLPGDRKSYLVNEMEYAIKTDWNGLRSAFSLGFSF